MKKRRWIAILLGLVLVFSLAACNQPTDTPPDTPDDSVTEITFTTDKQEDKINFYGRCYWDAQKGVSISNSGSGFEVTFRGTRLTAAISATQSTWSAPELHGNGYIYVFVDGVTLYRDATRIELSDVSGDAAEVVLADNLAEGEHTVKVLKATEVKYTSAYVKSVTCDGGFLTPPQKPTLKMELIGDSIMCGANAMRKSDGDETGTDSENALASYGAMAALRLGAQFNMICRSGLCVSGDTTGGKHYPSISDYYGLYSEADAKPWDFTSYIPDVVVIDLGTNDLMGSISVSQANVKTAYKNLIDTVRGHYPDAYIVCCTGAMNGGNDFAKTIGTLVDGIIDAYADADDKISHITLTQTSTVGHPTADMHNANSNLLAGSIRLLMGL